MEDIFSSNSGNIIQKKLDINANTSPVLHSNEDLDFYFDINKIVAWCMENAYKRVNISVASYITFISYNAD